MSDKQIGDISMMNFSRILVLAVAMVGMVLSGAASAAVLTPTAGQPATQSSPVIKVHDWHRNCEWGPVRFHRHVPGRGNVSCGRRGRSWCQTVRRECAHRWGYGTWRDRRCIRSRGC
jgi:hypothetical protein